jgi:hypothetical protein
LQRWRPVGVGIEWHLPGLPAAVGVGGNGDAVGCGLFGSQGFERFGGFELADQPALRAGQQPAALIGFGDGAGTLLAVLVYQFL